MKPKVPIVQSHKKKSAKSPWLTPPHFSKSHLDEEHGRVLGSYLKFSVDCTQEPVPEMPMYRSRGPAGELGMAWRWPMALLTTGLGVPRVPVLARPFLAFEKGCKSHLDICSISLLKKGGTTLFPVSKPMTS